MGWVAQQAANRFLGRASASSISGAATPVSAIVFGRVVINVKLGQVYKVCTSIQFTSIVMVQSRLILVASAL